MLLVFYVNSIVCDITHFTYKPYHSYEQWLNYSKVGGGTLHFSLCPSFPSSILSPPFLFPPLEVGRPPSS